MSWLIYALISAVSAAAKRNASRNGESKASRPRWRLRCAPLSF